MGRLSTVLSVATGSVVVAAGAAAMGAVPWVAVSAVAGAVLTGVPATMAAGSAWPSLRIYGTPVFRGAGPGVALTFDDGPDPTSTPVLLEALERASARATFYVLADHAEAHPDLARAIAERHELALHGRSHHPWLTVMDPAKGAAELREAIDILEQITGVRPTQFRPPFGATSPRVFAAAAEAGLQVVWCSVRTGDGGPMRPATLRARCRRAGPGDIVLLHEGARAAREALPGILEDLQARGLPAVTVGELVEPGP